MNTSVKEIFSELSKRDITAQPVSLLDGATMLLFEYAGKLRSIAGTSPDLTSATGRTIANNKYATYVYANKLGMTVPQTELYIDEAQANQFLEKYKHIVVKPLDGAHGHGVTINIETSDQLNSAIAKAKAVSDALLLQQQVAGKDLRVLIIDGQLAAASERVPASVVGDGLSTTAQLIEKENSTNPLRGVNYEKPLNKIDATAAMHYLGKVGMKVIPKKGETTQVVGTANIGTGGYAINRTDTLPPAIVDEAKKLASSIGVYTCGVDFLFDEDSQSWYFIEANSSPSFGLHLWPSKGEPVNVTETFVSRLLCSYDTQAAEKTVIGRNALVDIVGHGSNIPAKIDTGADRSSLWASNIEITADYKLRFVLFDKTSPYYTGKVVTTSEYSVSRVRSSSGHAQIRYRVDLPLKIHGRRVIVSFTLADRSKNIFPVLIGRRTLAGRFLVDVSQLEQAAMLEKQVLGLNEELKKDPHAFYKKYHASKDKGDKVER